MPKLATAYIEITGRTTKYRSEVGKAKRMTDDFSRSATRSLKRVTLGLAAMGAAAAAAAVAIGMKLARAMIRAARSAFQSAVRYDQLKRGLIAVAGSAKEAENQLIRLRDVAKLPGLSFREAIAGSTALQAAGLSAELAERSLMAFGNALVTVGKGARELQGVNLALTQIVTKQTGFGQELRQLSERLPQVRKAMKDAFGISTVEDFQRLGLTATDFITGLVKEFEKLEKVSGTVANSVENLGISFDILKAAVGTLFIKEVDAVLKGLTAIIDKLTIVVENYKKFEFEAARTFRRVGAIALRIVWSAFKKIGSVIINIFKLVGKILKYEITRIMKDISDIIDIGLIKLIGVIKGQSKYITTLLIGAVKASRIAWDIEFKRMRDADLDKSVHNMIENIRGDFSSLFVELMASIKEADSVLDEFVVNIPEKVATAAEKAKVALKPMESFWEDTDFDAKGFDFLGPFPVDPTARIREANNRIIAERENLDADMVQRVDTNLTRWQSYLDEVEDMAQRVSDAISPIFENMFTQLFSGNTKNLWEEFWADLKRMAIRQMATIFATQIVGGLLTGGTSFALPVIGSAIGGNFGRGWGSGGTAMSAAGGGLGAAGKFLEGGMNVGQINFHEVDLNNMDANRILKTTGQTIGPALAELRGNGIE